MPQTPHHGHRKPRGLALHEVAGGGQLVRRGDDGRAQRVAVRVGVPAQIVQHPHPGGADRHVREPRPPGPPEGVGDDDPDVDAERVPQPLAERPRRRVRVLGQQQHRARRGVGRVDPGRGHDQPLPVLDDPQRPAPGHHPDRLGVDRGLPVVRPDDPPLRLGHDLRRDQQHVPVGEPRLGGGDQLGQVVPVPHLGQPGHGPDPVTALQGPAHAPRTSSASRNASRAICVVASRSLIISGTARQRIPAASTRSTASASTVSTSQPSSSPEP